MIDESGTVVKTPIDDDKVIEGEVIDAKPE